MAKTYGFENNPTCPRRIKCSRVGIFLRIMLSKNSPHQKHIDSLITCKLSHTLTNCFGYNGSLPALVGNKYIPLIYNQLTNWFEAIPLRNQEASTVAEDFVNVCLSRFGCAADLHSDNGSHFFVQYFQEH